MHRLKDIAEAMDGCHERTAKRFWKSADAECAKAGLPRVRPDVRGHGAHKWKPATFARLIQLWEDYHTTRGTTPQIVRAKYAGDLHDDDQQNFNFNFNAKKPSSEQRIFTSTVGKTIASGKTGGDATAQKTRAPQSRRRRPAAAR